MKLIHVLRAVYCEPWLIRAEIHAQVASIVKAHVDGTAHLLDKMNGMEDGSELCPEMQDGVCIIPVDGIIGKRVSALEKSSGVVDSEDLCAALDMALEDENVQAVVLDINSPGGTVTGTPECADRVEALGKVKPVIAYCDMMCCSAAYWIASQARAIYSSGSASIGSIGVYMSMLDQSRAAEMQGLKQEVFKAGKYKGMGIPGTTLTPEQREHLQERVDMIHGQFKAAVRKGRGMDIADAHMEGQDFYGLECIENGLVDSIASRADAIRDAAKLGRK